MEMAEVNSQDVPPKKQSKLSASKGSAVDNLKLWLTEHGIDASNLEELIMEDNENNRRYNIPYEDSKGKFFNCLC